jgi:hypothetical protein
MADVSGGGRTIQAIARTLHARYVFVRSGTTWSQQAYLKASNTNGGDTFGYWVAVCCDRVVVGAPYEDSNATGVDGNQSNNSSDLSGAAYVFGLDDGVWVDLGVGLGGASGIPLLVGTGPLSTGSSNQLALTSAKPFTSALLIVGLSPLNAPFKGGVMVPKPLLLYVLSTNGLGALNRSFVMPAVPACVPLYFQYWIPDASAVHGYSASNGLKGTTT